jgi:hypothetical protein
MWRGAIVSKLRLTSQAGGSIGRLSASQPVSVSFSPNALMKAVREQDLVIALERNILSRKWVACEMFKSTA